MREGERKALRIFFILFLYFYILLGYYYLFLTMLDFYLFGFLIGVDGMDIERVGKYNIHSFNFLALSVI